MDANTELEKEKSALLCALEAEKNDIIKLKKYLSDLEFQNLKEKPDEVWNAEAFYKKCSTDVRSCVQSRKPQNSSLHQLEQLIASTQDILQLSCEDLTCTTKQGVEEWKAKCTTSSRKLGFSITMECKTLDDTQVKLMKVEMEDKLQAENLKVCIEDCIKENNIPMLIQSFATYTSLDAARLEFINKMKEEYKNCILLKQDKSDVLNLHIIDPTSGKLLLKVKWAIVCCLDTKKLSYCFTVRFEPAGQTLRGTHEDLIKNIVECTELNKDMISYWKKLCSFIVKSKSPEKISKKKK